MVIGEAAPGHLGVEHNGSFLEQISAIARDVEEFPISQACVSLAEALVQAHVRFVTYCLL
jgi:hypothetical protein